MNDESWRGYGHEVSVWSGRKWFVWPPSEFWRRFGVTWLVNTYRATL